MTPTPTRRPPKREASGGQSMLLVIVVCGVIVLAGVGLGIALLGGDDGGGGSSTSSAAGTDAFGDVNVVGTPLPTFDGTEDDPAIGEIAPQLSGQTPSGAGSSVGGRGAPTLIAFLAHWCPHCQRELPLLVDLQEDGAFEGMRTTAVLTGTDPNAPNYPPADWLVREGWEGNVLLDDQQSTGATAYGLAGYPYLVFLNANGEVVARADGELPVETIEAYLDEARGEG